MRKIVLYEPSIGSDNLGDQIIVDGVKTALGDLISKSFGVELPTHTPVNWRYLRYLEKRKSDFKFVCGSNIIVGKLNDIVHLRQWAIPLLSMRWYGPVVLVGVGAQQYHQKINWYTKLAYKCLLKKDVLHSVRDSYTERTLKKIGISNVINTACPTMWGLTVEHCKEIPQNKARYCVCTLTDYKKNISRDNYILDILKKNYEKVFFWPQGNGDLDYFCSLEGSVGIEVIAANLESYNQYLENCDTDYVGTRLHGGMRALQKKRRTLIIGVDNRAKELQADFGIPVIDQESIENLGEVIQKEISLNIKLPTDGIKKFLSQFGINYTE